MTVKDFFFFFLDILRMFFITIEIILSSSTFFRRFDVTELVSALSIFKKEHDCVIGHSLSLIVTLFFQSNDASLTCSSVSLELTFTVPVNTWNPPLIFFCLTFHENNTKTDNGGLCVQMSVASKQLMRQFCKNFQS